MNAGELLKQAQQALDAGDYEGADSIAKAASSQSKGYAQEAEALSIRGKANVELNKHLEAAIFLAQAGQVGRRADCYILAARTALAVPTSSQFDARTNALAWYDEAVAILVSSRKQTDKLQEILAERERLTW